MKRYLRLLLPLVAVVFLTVAGCGEPKPAPVTPEEAEAAMPEMPADPQAAPAEGAAPAEAAP